MDSVDVLFLGSQSDLIDYVTKNVKSKDRFVLIIPGDTVNHVLNDVIYQLVQVRRIYVLYDNDNHLEADKSRIENKDGKVQFCYKRNLNGIIERLKVDTANNSSGSNGQEMLANIGLSATHRISAKRQNVATRRCTSAEKRLVSPSKQGVLVRYIEQVDSHYICSSCKAMFRDPHQMECGHRICKYCINTENNQTICSTCLQSSSNQFIWFDDGFHREIGSLSVACVSCDWKGVFQLYLEHIDENHPNEEEKSTVRNIASQQPHKSRLHEPDYTAASHERSLSDILSTSPSMAMPDSSHTVNTPFQILLNHINEMIGALSHRAAIISHDQNSIAAQIQSSSQSLDHNFFSSRASREDFLSQNNQLKLMQDLYTQEISSFQQAIHDPVLTCYNGAYMWKITSVRDKIADAQSERQKSIYSPVFYSSGNGYKLRLRLYLNGDGDTRDKYISVFLVIMKNAYDAILPWPFPYKVSVRLINQSAPNNDQGHIIHSISPDGISSSFQRPIYDMNEAYGVKGFISVEQFEQNDQLFIQDDTMFIKVNLDFLSPDLPFSTFTGGSPNDEEHVGAINDNFM